MSKPYRTYQRSLELEIEAYKYLGRGDHDGFTSKMKQASDLHDEWARWIDAHRADARLPDVGSNRPN